MASEVIELMKEAFLSTELQTSSPQTEGAHGPALGPGSHPLEHISEGLLEKLLVGWFLILYGLILIRNAWLSDDAYITLRVVDNFINGFGLRYNIDERVQVFTHPLWMFLLSAIYTITREAYLTPLFLSFTASLLSVYVVAFRLAATPLSALLTLLSLILSQSFMDYSSSGLENPLTHLLAVLILYLFIRREVRFKNLLIMAFLTSLAMLNRMDTILLFLPMLAVWVWQYGIIRGFFTLVVGFLPFVMWEIFSILYYGFPFPNVAYAKLGADVGAGSLFVQGLFYFLDSIETDPLTPLVIFLGILIPFLVQNRKHLPVIAGVLLYLIYLLRIGGDFMSGRFFSAPFLLMTALISTYPFTTSLRTWPLPFVVVLVMGLSSAHPTLILPSARSAPKEGEPVFTGYISPRGIANERLFYFFRSGLIHVNEDFIIESENALIQGNEHTKVRVVKCAGFYGYECPREAHVIDIWALLDPLLARLPAIKADRGEGRIGHFDRMIPEGYVDTLESGKDHFADRSLAEYYQVLRRLTHDGLFSPGRLQAIWDMNLGRYNPLIDTRRYLNPGMRLLRLDEVSIPKAEELPLEDPCLTEIKTDGIQIDLGQKQTASRIEISLDPGTAYDLYLTSSPSEVGHVNIPPTPEKSGLVVHTLQVPSEAIAQGYNLIRLFPRDQDHQKRLGHVRLLDRP